MSIISFFYFEPFPTSVQGSLLKAGHDDLMKREKSILYLLLEVCRQLTIIQQRLRSLSFL